GRLPARYAATARARLIKAVYLDALEQEQIKRASEQWLREPWAFDPRQRLTPATPYVLHRTGDRRDRRTVLGPRRSRRKRGNSGTEQGKTTRRSWGPTRLRPRSFRFRSAPLVPSWAPTDERPA